MTQALFEKNNKENLLKNKIDSMAKGKFFNSFINEGFEVLKTNNIEVTDEDLKRFFGDIKDLDPDYKVSIKGRKYKKIVFEYAK